MGYSIYIWHVLCESDKKWKTCRHMSVISCVWLHMWFSNVTKWITRCSDWSELDVSIQNFINQPSDSCVQAGFPKENRSKGERGVWNTQILQCHIRYFNVAYTFGFACCITHIWNLGFMLKAFFTSWAGLNNI